MHNKSIMLKPGMRKVPCNRLLGAYKYFETELERKNLQIEELYKQITLVEERCNKLESMMKARLEGQYDLLDYYDFENHFRGSVELIKQRQSMYLPYLIGKNNVFDLGCGRGEFLSLMKENGIRAKGIDIFQGYVNLCREQGLDVIQGDGIEYLRNTDERFDAIFVSQVVEHLDVNQIITLCKCAYDRLDDEGMLIIETPNPCCLSIFSNAFFIDPSHIKPVHPLTLGYFLEKSGFNEKIVINTEASKAGSGLPILNLDVKGNLHEYNEAISKLSQLIYGSQDYAIIAVKADKENLINKMYAGSNAVVNPIYAVIETCGFIYGPYIYLPQGKYKLNVIVNKDVNVKITADSGQKVIAEVLLQGGNSVTCFELQDQTKEVEFVITSLFENTIVTGLYIQGE